MEVGAEGREVKSTERVGAEGKEAKKRLELWNATKKCWEPGTDKADLKLCVPLDHAAACAQPLPTAKMPGAAVVRAQSGLPLPSEVLEDIEERQRAEMAERSEMARTDRVMWGSLRCKSSAGMQLWKQQREILELNQPSVTVPSDMRVIAPIAMLPGKLSRPLLSLTGTFRPSQLCLAFWERRRTLMTISQLAILQRALRRAMPPPSSIALVTHWVLPPPTPPLALPSDDDDDSRSQHAADMLFNGVQTMPPDRDAQDTGLSEARICVADGRDPDGTAPEGAQSSHDTELSVVPMSSKPVPLSPRMPFPIDQESLVQERNAWDRIARRATRAVSMLQDEHKKCTADQKQINVHLHHAVTDLMQNASNAKGERSQMALDAATLLVDAKEHGARNMLLKDEIGEAQKMEQEYRAEAERHEVHARKRAKDLEELQGDYAGLLATRSNMQRDHEKAYHLYERKRAQRAAQRRRALAAGQKVDNSGPGGSDPVAAQEEEEENERVLQYETKMTELAKTVLQQSKRVEHAALDKGMSLAKASAARDNAAREDAAPFDAATRARLANRIHGDGEAWAQSSE